MVKKIITWGFIAFLIFFVAFNPQGMVDVVKMLGNTAASVLAGIGDFFSGLAS